MSTLTALERAEAFIAGFEDDEAQEGIAEMLAAVRGAIAELRTESQPVIEGGLPEDVRAFIYHITLELQQNRSRTPEQMDALFQRAYKLYVKYDVENREADRSAPAEPTGHKCGGAWVIHFDDADRRHEVFTDRAAAFRRWAQISVSWNAHLFARIAVNSRDAIPAADPMANRVQ